jgi:3-hydroxybutyryl-CoA dehydrogenase
VTTTEIKAVGVVGLGTMGAGIAEVFAKNGFSVVGVERDDEALAAGRGHLDRSTGKAVARGRMTETERDVLVGRLTFTTDLSRIAGCELVIEAIPERLEWKLDVFTRVDAVVSSDAILATNTSSLSVSEIAAATKDPGRVVGMHFFNPAPVLKLVEVVRADQTRPEVVAVIESLARSLGKSPVVCGDEAGFIANALLFGYLNQAAGMVESGADAAQVDASVEHAYGYPMGPLALLDLIGLDTSVEILDRMYSATGLERHRPAGTLAALVADGKLGRKSGAGFYAHDEAAPDPTPAARPELADQLIQPYLADAQAMADRGYATPADIDMAMRLGCGLPKGPFELMAEAGSES